MRCCDYVIVTEFRFNNDQETSRKRLKPTFDYVVFIKK